MTKYRVPYTVTWAGGSIDVETDETDPEKIVELAYEEGGGTLCHQCTGGRYGTASLELSGEIDVDKDDDGPVVYLNDYGKYERYKGVDDDGS